MRPKSQPRVIERDDGRRSTTVVVQRCCNGCGHEIGDVTNDEVLLAYAGRMLPDVRHECPWCAPFLAEAADA